MNANISVTNSSVLIAPQDTAKARARRQFMWGITLVVLANLLFGVLYTYGKWLSPLIGTSVFLWRMVMILGCLSVFLVVSGQSKTIINDLKAIKGVKSWFWLLLPTPIFASQLWLFCGRH